MVKKSAAVKTDAMDFKQVAQNLARVGVKVSLASNEVKNEKRLSLIAGDSNKELSVK
ncbi:MULTISPECIES: hypothetical protein [Bacillus cereus group]|uniref:hypothetical protein n=1 Tax=Bacillus cereus group TaxID=86661 RepID=UPI00159BBD06|nr:MULTISPECIES: hypothetical protein [Bacillus cereus group]